MTKLRAVLRRRWPILVVTTLLGMVAGVASTALGPDRETVQYQAEQVVVANRLAGNPANVPQDALKVTRGEVPKVAAEALGEPENEDALTRRVRVSNDVDSSSIKLLVYDDDPERASEIVQAYANAFLRVVNSELRSEDTRQIEQLSQRVDEAAAALATFDEQYPFITRSDQVLPDTPAINALVAERQRLADRSTEAERTLRDAELEVSLREPYTTLGPEAPREADSQLLEVPDSPAFRAGLIGLIGLLLGAGLVLLVERVNQRVDTREELAELIKVPIIAEIGRIPSRKRPSFDDGRVQLDGLWSEHYRRVRSAIQFVQADAEAARRSGALGGNGSTAAVQPGAVISGHHAGSGDVPRVFLFASALPGEGKSTSTALTALALAETGDDTLVINADFRRPAVEKYLGARRSPSLADRAELTVDRPSVDQVVQQTHQEHLWIAAAGPPTHEVGGRLQAAREVALEAARRGGTVLIDSSPLRVSNDPIDLLPAVDEVILVVRAGRSTVKSIEDTLELLDMHHAPVLGVVLIGTMAVREMYAYYQSYYHQAAEADQVHQSQGAAAGARVGATPAPAAAPPADPSGAPVPPPYRNGAAQDERRSARQPGWDERGSRSASRR